MLSNNDGKKNGSALIGKVKIIQKAYHIPFLTAHTIDSYLLFYHFEVLHFSSINKKKGWYIFIQGLFKNYDMI